MKDSIINSIDPHPTRTAHQSQSLISDKHTEHIETSCKLKAHGASDAETIAMRTIVTSQRPCIARQPIDDNAWKSSSFGALEPASISRLGNRALVYLTIFAPRERLSGTLLSWKRRRGKLINDLPVTEMDRQWLCVRGPLPKVRIIQGVRLPSYPSPWFLFVLVEYLDFVDILKLWCDIRDWYGAFWVWKLKVLINGERWKMTWGGSQLLL